MKPVISIWFMIIWNCLQMICCSKWWYCITLARLRPDLLPNEVVCIIIFWMFSSTAILRKIINYFCVGLCNCDITFTEHSKLLDNDNNNCRKWSNINYLEWWGPTMSHCFIWELTLVSIDNLAVYFSHTGMALTSLGTTMKINNHLYKLRHFTNDRPRDKDLITRISPRPCQLVFYRTKLGCKDYRDRNTQTTWCSSWTSSGKSTVSLLRSGLFMSSPKFVDIKFT